MPWHGNVDAVCYLVDALGQADVFEERDRVGAANTAAAATQAGVARIVHLGGLGADEAGSFSSHLASRHEVSAVLASGPVPVIELRAGVIIGSGSVSFEMLRHRSEVLPVMMCPRWVTQTRCQPIGISDVGTYQEMMHRYAAIAGLRR